MASAQRSPYTAKVDSSRPSFVGARETSFGVDSSVQLKDITQLELYNLNESNKPVRDLKLGTDLTARKRYKSKKSKKQANRYTTEDSLSYNTQRITAAAVHPDKTGMVASSKNRNAKQEFPTVKSTRNGHKMSGGLSLDKEVKNYYGRGVGTNRTISRDNNKIEHFNSSRLNNKKCEVVCSPMAEINQE